MTFVELSVSEESLTWMTYRVHQLSFNKLSTNR